MSAPDAGAPAPGLPAATLREAAPHLRRPFAPEAVRWKVQHAAGTSGLIVGYIDARLAIERLNLVVADLWHDDYAPGQDGLLCKLTVDGVTRRDVGAGKGKAAYSDAFKRAAVKFGVGVSLYALPQTWLRVTDGHLKLAGPSRDKLILEPAGVEHLRDRYRIWLGTDQGSSFGEPLAHGDALEGSIGDPLDPDAQAEHDPEPERDPDPPPPERPAPGPARLTQGQRQLIAVRAGRIDPATYERLLRAEGVETADDLSPAGADALLNAIDQETA